MYQRVFNLTALLLLIVIGQTPRVFGKETPFDKFTPEDRVSIRADMMSYDQKRNLYHAEGNVIIKQGGAILKADTVLLNTVTQEAQASGNVSFQEEENTLFCDSLDINLDTQLGTVSKATIFVKEDNYHIGGEEFEKVGDKSYRIEKGTLTTCDGDVPVWKITGGEMDVTLDGYATLKNSTFQIHNVPVMYFPYFLYPVRIKRQTGLLMPEGGYSGSKGVIFNNSFYWAISDNTDATFYLDYASEKGVGEGIEFRYVLNERSKGKLYQYYTEERSSYFDDEYYDPLDRDRKRGFVNFEGEHYFNETSYVKSIATWLSDRQIYQDYTRVFNRTDSELDRITLQSQERNKSFLFYTKNWSHYSFTGELDYYKDLRNSNDETLQRLPSFNFSGTRQSIFKTPLFFKVDSAYDYYVRDRGVEGHRIDLFPKISLPLNLRNYLKITPEFGVRGLFAMDLSENSSDYEQERALYDANVEVSTTVLKVYNLSNTKIPKLKHSIEPTFFYQYIPDADQEDFPIFEPLDRFYDRNALTYSLVNRFTGKVLQPDNSYSEEELGYLKVSQTYYFTDPGLPWFHEGYNGNEFSDILTELRLRFSSYAFLRATADYNPYENNLTAHDTMVLLNYKDSYLRFGYSYLRDGFDGFRINGRVRLHKSWVASYETRQSDYKTLDSLYGLEYSAQCWGVGFFVEDKAKKSGKESDIEYSVLFTLAGLGKLGGFEGSLD
jgi:LPS-assembly protein